ncbi:1-aminocyclopropane-1-carboxylate deaminase/D-cysteine desulfhydrase [Gilvimarinus polysaccharolyticus]|uniref:1-aminocyclopropane-1-carboxylate deaminase/D-cysteine desulfhydrase n=1 Tax=Gilvimarinus polysaccharolyticus TaxID=863921 RepID=UPI000A920B41|nr:pyridoxal-phosphate dependent enzyme [Gilvimarinus polysaccharolyticus]
MQTVLDTWLLTRALSVTHQPINLPNCRAAGVNVLLRRDDQLPGGNKFYKLFFNLKAAQTAGKDTLVSLGGAHSNHLHALALACKAEKLKSRMLVRGYAAAADTPTLQDVKAAGGMIEFVGHGEYRRLCQSQQVALQPNEHLIPEGAANPLGEQGASYIGRAVQQQLGTDVRHIIMAAGTGSTLAGVASGLSGATEALGVSVLKGPAGGSLYSNGQGQKPRWKMLWGFCGKGYGRPLSTAMLRFWQQFEHDNGVLLDPIYTLKMLWAINQLAKLGYWRRGDQVVAVHTGGLQGRRGFAQQPEAAR